jgi:hypothetical protein
VLLPMPDDVIARIQALEPAAQVAEPREAPAAVPADGDIALQGEAVAEPVVPLNGPLYIAPGCADGEDDEDEDESDNDEPVTAVPIIEEPTVEIEPQVHDQDNNEINDIDSIPEGAGK